MKFLHSLFGNWHYWRKHKQVILIWNNWLAIQVVLIHEWSLGVRLEAWRPLIDIFLPYITIAIGKHPVLSAPATMQYRHSARGFIPADQPPEHWIGHEPIDQTKVKFPERDDSPIL